MTFFLVWKLYFNKTKKKKGKNAPHESRNWWSNIGDVKSGVSHGIKVAVNKCLYNEK